MIEQDGERRVSTASDASQEPTPGPAEVLADTPETPDTPAAAGSPDAGAPDQSPAPDAADASGKPADEPIVQEGMSWFALRVASNKESSVRDTLLRKVAIENKTEYVGRILVPTEKSRSFKNGKMKVTETKLYPGYVFVEMRLEDDGRIPQDVFFLIKETTGVGDFVGTAGRPTPMQEHEITKMLLDSKKPDDEPTIRLTFEKGEAVTITEGPFEGYEGTVDELNPEKGEVTVLVTIFGRQAPINLEEWQITKTDEV